MATVAPTMITVDLDNLVTLYYNARAKTLTLLTLKGQKVVSPLDPERLDTHIQQLPHLTGYQFDQATSSSAYVTLWYRRDHREELGIPKLEAD